MLGQTIDRLLINIEVGLHNARTGFKFVDKSLKRIGSATVHAQNQLNKFNLGFRELQGALLGVGLSFMFTGMAIGRYFQGILRSLFQTYLQVEGEGSSANDKVNEVLASLYFLAWSLFAAFEETGALDEWIARIDKLTDWFNNLNEESKASIINFLVWGVIVGGVMMIFGQTLLFLLGILTLIMFFITQPAILGFLIILGLIVMAFIVWNSEMSTTEKWLWTFVIVIGIIIILLLIFGGLAALPFIAMMLGIGIVLGLFALLIRKTKDVGFAFEALGFAILKIMGWVGDAIIGLMIAPLRGVIELINAAIRGSNKFLHTNFSEIPIPEWLKFGRITAQVNEKIADLNLRVEESKMQKRIDEANSGVASPILSGVLPDFASTITNTFGSFSSDTMAAQFKIEAEMDKYNAEMNKNPTIIPSLGGVGEVLPNLTSGLKDVFGSFSSDMTSQFKEANEAQLEEMKKMVEEIKNMTQLSITNNIEGIISEDSMSSFLDQMNEKMSSYQGSPQS